MHIICTSYVHHMYIICSIIPYNIILCISYLHHIYIMQKDPISVGEIHAQQQQQQTKNLDALHISVLDPKPGKISGVAQLAQKCELFLFYLSSVYIYHTNIIAYSYKCIQIYIYRYMYLYLCVYLCMSLHICGETITNWSLPKIHKTATKISRSLKSP
jgi:hypothetical protein